MILLELELKLKNIVDTECNCADKYHRSKLSTCDARHWDKDVWNYRNDVINAIRKRGYIVTTSTNWGVLDIVTTKQITL